MWPNAIMESAMSITVGLARKDLITYWAYIFRFRDIHDSNDTMQESYTLCRDQ